MIARAGTGWQTVLADLSLILFMVTASAAAQGGPDITPALPVLPTLGDPVAVWRSGGGISLEQWLKNQPDDPRQRLTIVVPYADNTTKVAPKALALASAAGRSSRLMFEPGDAGDAYATLTYDVAQTEGAHR